MTIENKTEKPNYRTILEMQIKKKEKLLHELKQLISR